MNQIIEELPPYERVLSVSEGETLAFVLPKGQAMVKIHRTLRVCNFVIFFGAVEEQFVHGYLDYEGGMGKIATDE